VKIRVCCGVEERWVQVEDQRLLIQRNQQCERGGLAKGSSLVLSIHNSEPADTAGTPSGLGRETHVIDPYKRHTHTRLATQASIDDGSSAGCSHHARQGTVDFVNIRRRINECSKHH
jgi:hypothetical protein